MKSDNDIAAQSLELQIGTRTVPLLPWPLRLVIGGQTGRRHIPALIAHLDAISVFGFPEEMAEVDDTVFDELLSDVSAEAGE